MGPIKKTLFTIGFCLAMFCAFAGKHPNSVSVVFPQDQQAIFSDNAAHTDDFLQPQGTHHFVGNSKSEQHYTVKFFWTTTGPVSQSKVLNPVISYYFQDIDRCEKVSLHLFPYHFFW